MDSPDRVSMKVSIFSPDGKNFCQFMTPHFPKPRFLAQFHLGLVGALIFYLCFPKTDIWALLVSVVIFFRAGFARSVPTFFRARFARAGSQKPGPCRVGPSLNHMQNDQSSPER